jgi:hypothetical protein
LLSHRFGERGDMFDAALQEARTAVGSALAPEDLGQENEGDDRPRHRRSK